MAHFAKLDKNNVVIAIHSLNNEVIMIEGNEIEQLGIDFLKNIHGHENWKQTSYNAKFRKHYAGIGYKFDVELNAFIPPKPFESWILNLENCIWEAPIVYPNDGNIYTWNEESLSWDEAPTL